MVSVMTSEDANLGTSGGPYTGHTEAKVVSSTDGGMTSGGKVEVFPQQSVWPGLVGLDKGSFLVLADHGGAMSQRFTMA